MLFAYVRTIIATLESTSEAVFVFFIQLKTPAASNKTAELAHTDKIRLLLQSQPEFNGISNMQSNNTFQLEEEFYDGCLPFGWWSLSEITQDGFGLVVAILDCLISGFSVFGNGLVMYTIYHCTNLHSPSNLLIAGLALSDFGTGFITHPSHVIEYAAAFRGDSCTATIAFMVLNISGWLFTILSLLTLTFIAIERYCAVVFHLRFNEIVTVKRTMISLSSAWIIIFSVSLLTASKKIVGRHLLFAHGVVILIGILITSLCYFKVFLVLRRHCGQINMQLQAPTSEQLAINTARYRRKFLTVFYIVGAFVACHLPYSIVIFSHLNQRFRIMLLTILLGGNSCINPLIYFWRIRVLREAAVRHVIKIVKCRGNN